jgi:hypothetical protein
MVELEDSVARMQALMRELKKEQNVNGKLNAQIQSCLTGGSGWATVLQKLVINYRPQMCQTRKFMRKNDSPGLLGSFNRDSGGTYWHAHEFLTICISA